MLEASEAGLSQHMVDFAKSIPKESIVEIVGLVTVPEVPVKGCSQAVEVRVKECWIVNKSAPILPF